MGLENRRQSLPEASAGPQKAGKDLESPGHASPPFPLRFRVLKKLDVGRIWICPSLSLTQPRVGGGQEGHKRPTAEAHDSMKHIAEHTQQDMPGVPGRPCGSCVGTAALGPHHTPQVALQDLERLYNYDCYLHGEDGGGGEAGADAPPQLSSQGV